MPSSFWFMIFISPTTEIGWGGPTKKLHINTLIRKPQQKIFYRRLSIKFFQFWLGCLCCNFPKRISFCENSRLYERMNMSIPMNFLMRDMPLPCLNFCLLILTNVKISKCIYNNTNTQKYQPIKNIACWTEETFGCALIAQLELASSLFINWYRLY